MAGHSKWHNIKHRKAASDAKKGKIFTVHAKLIALAAQNWADPNDNPNLYEAIAKAKADNVPNANIDRAIKRWAWLDKDAAKFVEIIYEWYGAWWVAIVLKTITDNKNRTASEVRHIFSKFWWNLWEKGSVTNFTFKLIGECIVDVSWQDEDAIEEILLEAPIEDYEFKDWILRIEWEKSDLWEIKKVLLKNNLKIIQDWLEYVPNTESNITDEVIWLKVVQLLNWLNELDDVSNVWSNEVISESMSEDISKKIEDSVFKY